MKPIPNSIAASAAELAEWRRDFHRHPELAYAEHRTAGLVAERLAAFGLDAVETGIGGTGVVGVLHGRDGAGPGGNRADGADGADRTIMLRADMDALPIAEATGVDYASGNLGVMHACGHDGHTTMLLGAARQLAETRNFAGTVYFCFQPAEEGGAGAKAMLDDGLLERFPVGAVYGMHNWPGLPVGEFAVKDGPVMAAAGKFTVVITGSGGHAARPHTARDPIVAGAQIVTALQTVVSRVVDPLEPAVLSVTRFAGGAGHNVIPERVELAGTIRTFDEGLYAEIERELERISAQVADALRVRAEVAHGPNPYPPTVNDPDQADFVEGVLRAAFGDARVHRGHEPSLTGEDFAFLAREVPAAYILVGNGESAPLHHPAYDFNDEVAPLGAAYWTALVERALPRSGGGGSGGGA